MARATKKRPYDLRLRGERADARKLHVIEVAADLFLASSFEDVTLKDVADAAGVSLKTVVRRFGSKDELFLACAHAAAEGEPGLRAVAPGDVRGVASALAERYETIGEVTARYAALETRFPAVAKMMKIARRGHLDWLADVFAPWLARDRASRLAQVFGATEIYVWRSWRVHLRLDRRTAESALRGTLEALVAHWQAGEGKKS